MSAPILINVVNKTDKIQNFELFNAYNYKSGKLDITGNIDYREILNNIIKNPVQIDIMYIITSTNFDSMPSINLFNKSIYKNKKYQSFKIEIVPHQEYKEIFSMKKLFVLDGHTKIKGKISPETTLNFHFYPYTPIILFKEPKNAFYG